MAIFQDTTCDIAVDPNNGDIVYVLSYNSLYKSTDTGDSFADMRFPEGMHGAGRMAVRPGNSNILYVAGTFRANNKGCLAILKSGDGGQTWTAVKFDTGAAYSTCVGIAVSPKNPNIIYFCGYFYGANSRSYKRVYRSKNGGNSWDNITGPILNQKDTTPSGLAVDPNQANILYAPSGSLNDLGVYKSTDGGASWTQLAIPAGFDILCLAVDPEASGTLYFGGGSGIFKSRDGGSSWAELTGAYNAKSMAVNPKNGNEVFVETGPAFFTARTRARPGRTSARACP